MPLRLVRLIHAWRKLCDELRRRARMAPARPALRRHAPPAGRFFFAPEDVPGLVETLHKRLPGETARLIAQAERVCRHRFDLAGFEGLDFGAEIDWHLDPLSGTRTPPIPWYRLGDAPLAVRELNRHQHLVTLAKAFLLTHNRRFLEEIQAQWYAWQVRNRYPLGINWGDGLEAAFRALAWIWTGALLSGHAPGEFHRALAGALGMHARRISRFLNPEPGLERLGGAVALFSAGVLYPQFRAARHWRALGWAIIQDESLHPLPWAPDTPDTQPLALAATFFLHARLLAGRNNIAIPPGLDSVILRAGEALRLLSQTDTRMPASLATAAAVLTRPDLKIAGGDPPEETLWMCSGLGQWDKGKATRPRYISGCLPESGVYCLVDGGPPPRKLLLDRFLNLRWPVAGRLRISGLALLRLAHAATVERWVSSPGFDLFAGSGDGYRRWVVSWKSGPVVVRDLMAGQSSLDPVQNWHPGPGFQLASESPGFRRFTAGSDAAVSFCWTEQPGALAVALPPDGGTASFASLPCPAPLAVFEYTGNSLSLVLLFHDGAGHWAWRDWSGDAAFVAFGTQREEPFVVAAGASRLAFRGHPLLSEAAPRAYWELRGADAIDAALSAHAPPPQV